MEPTICYNCKHFQNRAPGTARGDIWYNHICKASPLPLIFSYVTGKPEPQEYAHCRDINTNGQCAKFEAKMP